MNEHEEIYNLKCVEMKNEDYMVKILSKYISEGFIGYYNIDINIYSPDLYLRLNMDFKRYVFNEVIPEEDLTRWLGEYYCFDNIPKHKISVYLFVKDYKNIKIRCERLEKLVRRKFYKSWGFKDGRDYEITGLIFFDLFDMINGHNKSNEYIHKEYMSRVNFYDVKYEKLTARLGNELY